MANWIQDLLKNKEKEKVAQLSDELMQIPPKEVGEKEYQRLFADLDKRCSRPRTCLPRGANLVQYLLVSGKSTCIDLAPCSDVEFEKLHRLDIKTALQLIERGLLSVNIWDTRPSAWNDTERGVLELAKKGGFVNWYRTQRFFELLCPDFQGRIDQRTKQIEDAFRPLNSSHFRRLTTAAQVLEPTEVPLVTGRRWAYLDVVNPSSADQAESYLKQRAWKRFVTFVRAATLLQTSWFVGAYGGTFIWGPGHLSVVSDQGKRWKDFLAQQINPGLLFQLDKQELEYLLHELTGVQPLSVLDAVESHSLLAFLQDDDNHTLAEKVFDTAEKLPEMIQRGDTKASDQLDFKSYKEWVSELQRRLNGLATDMRVVGGLTGLAAGVMGGPVGIAIGGIIIWLSSVYEGTSLQVASKLYSLFDPSAMKALATVKDLRNTRAKS